MGTETKALLDRAAKYIAKGLEVGAYAETVGGDRVAERVLEGIRRQRAIARPQAADTKRLLDRAAQYVGKGLAEGAYRATAGGDALAERLLDQLEQARGSRRSAHATKKAPAQLQREINEALARTEVKPISESSYLGGLRHKTETYGPGGNLPIPKTPSKKTGLPGVSKWNTTAGGIGAAEGKRGYSFQVEQGTYYISPYTTRHGRHAGYLLKFAATGGRPRGGHSGLWHDLGSHRSPQTAAKAAATHHAGGFE